MGCEIKAVGKDSRDIYRRFYRTIYMRPMVICAAILALWALCYFLAEESRNLADVCYVGFCLVLAVVMLLLPRIIADRTYRNRMKYYDGRIPEVTARFGEQLVLEDADSLHTVSYHQITRMYFLEDALMLVIAKEKVLCVPIQTFIRGSMPELKRFLREKCPKLKISD